MKTFAVHSPYDAALLIRLHDDLVKHGIETDTEWNRFMNPRHRNNEAKKDSLLVDAEHAGRSVYYFTLIVTGRMFYVSQSGNKLQECRDLTPSNYDAILSEIIESRS